MTRSHNHYCRRKAINVTYSECVYLALIIQYAVLMGRITLSSLACLADLYCCTLSHKRYNFREKVIESKICVFNLSLTFVRNVSRSEKILPIRNHKCT
jgi:hypothetical protein